jgi:hypothetical protein
MTVQDVHTELAGKLGNLSGRSPIAEADMARHRHARQPEHAIVGETAELYRIALQAGIEHEADLGPELRLT